MNKELVTLKFMEDGIKTVICDDNGKKTYKNISIESLRDILSEDLYFDTGFLGLMGENYKGIRRYIIKGNRHIFLVESSPFAGRLVYDCGNDDEDEQVFDQVPFPGLLMGVVLEKTGDHYNMLRSSLYALKTPVLNETDMLYRYPFSNIYSGNSSKICWGDVDFRPYLKPNRITSLLSLFINSEINDDLFSRPNNTDFGCIVSYLDEIDGGKFDHSHLHELMPVKGLLTSLQSNRL
jgi:hypothetical protein